jgi:hypothetical protein
MAWLAELEQARLESDRNRADPWARTLERALRDVQAISSVALLDLLGVAPTTGNARRLAHTMRLMGFIGIKSRRLMPGGFRDTTIRGWARPLREKSCSNSTTSAAAQVKKGHTCKPKLIST